MKEKDTIYHYTSHASAMSMISNFELWLTNIRFMNDAKEFLWVYDRLNEIISKRKEENKILNSLIENDISVREDKSKRNISICVSSFSFNKDDVAQWVQYGSNGEGISVGFNTEKLLECIKEKHSVAGSVIYDQKKIIEEIEIILDTLEEEIKITGNHSLRKMNDPIAKLATLAKNQTFASEKEFRIALLGVPYTNYDFFSRLNTIVPYTKLKITKDCIEEIMIGPKSSKESEQAWKLFLSSRRLNIEVKSSKSTLR